MRDPLKVLDNFSPYLTTASGINIVKGLGERVPGLTENLSILAPVGDQRRFETIGPRITVEVPREAERAETAIDEQTTTALRDVVDQEARRLDKIASNKLLQARLSFWLAWVFIACSGLVTLYGLVNLVLVGDTNAAMTAVSGAASSFFSNVVFKFYQYANDKLDTIQPGLAALHGLEKALTS